MHDAEQSDRPIVPGKPSNKGPAISLSRDRGLAERAEGRGLTEGNLYGANKTCTQRQGDVVSLKQTRRERSRIQSTHEVPRGLSNGLMRIREAANQRLCVNTQGRSRMR